jgi:GNAT superfamily N-acetyltransferase
MRIRRDRSSAPQRAPACEDGAVRRDLDGGYALDDDRARIDREAVHRFLSTEAYWALGRERAVSDELIEMAARVVGLYAPDGSQAGFARAVSDGHTVSYLADVYVLAEHRRRGLGSELVRFAVDGAAFASTKWLLHTRDMHPLYAKVGFGAAGERTMERWPAERRV